MFIMESNVDCVNLAQQEMSTGEYGRLESLRAVVVPRLDFKLVKSKRKTIIKLPGLR